MPSSNNLILSARRAFCGEKADAAQVGHRESQFWAEAVERAHEVRGTSDNRFIDVEFDDFTTDQMATVRSIYEQLSLALAAETECAMLAWLDSHPRRGAKGPKYDLAQFGLTREMLARNFAAYRLRRGHA